MPQLPLLPSNLACYIKRTLQYGQLHLPCGMTGQTLVCIHMQWANSSRAGKLGQAIDHESHEDSFTQLVDCLIWKLRLRSLWTGYTAVTVLATTLLQLQSRQRLLCEQIVV